MVNCCKQWEREVFLTLVSLGVEPDGREQALGSNSILHELHQRSLVTPPLAIHADRLLQRSAADTPIQVIELCSIEIFKFFDAEGYVTEPSPALVC